MRKLFWALLLFVGYIWMISSGHETFVLSQGKAIYKFIVTWLEDADVSYNLKKEKYRKSRRWD